MKLPDRISIDPAILSGKPAVKGTRIGVEQVLRMVARGWTNDQIRRQLPSLAEEDIRDCLIYAADLVDSVQPQPISA